jgi:hypothetical protein
MAYVPKNMVNQNLYTNGGEFTDPSTGKAYQGYYHQYYSGDIFLVKDLQTLIEKNYLVNSP